MRRQTRALAPLSQWGRTSGRLARRGFWPLALLFAALMAGWLWRGAFWSGLAALLLLWPMLAAAARRLHDTGRSARWLCLLLPPLTPLLLVLLVLPPTQRPTRHDRSNDSPTAPFFIALIAALLVVLSLFGTIGSISRANMKPGLLPGDLVWIWRRGAGGWREASCWPALCPFASAAPPEPGMLVALRTGVGAMRIGRVIALPGQRVELRAGRLFVDEVAQPTRPLGVHQEAFGPQGPARLLPLCRNGAVGLGARCQKSAANEAGRTILDAGRSGFDDFGPVTVPEGRVFLLSDNRDRGEDSRISPRAGGLGMARQSDIIGRVARVIVSARGAGLWSVWTWRIGRIGKGLT